MADPMFGKTRTGHRRSAATDDLVLAVCAHSFPTVPPMRREPIISIFMLA